VAHGFPLLIFQNVSAVHGGRFSVGLAEDALLGTVAAAIPAATIAIASLATATIAIASLATAPVATPTAIAAAVATTAAVIKLLLEFRMRFETWKNREIRQNSSAGIRSETESTSLFDSLSDIMGAYVKQRDEVSLGHCLAAQRKTRKFSSRFQKLN